MFERSEKLSLEADRFKRRILFFFGVFALFLLSAGALNYVLQNKNSALKSLLNATQEEQWHWQLISEKYRFLSNNGSQSISDNAFARMRQDLAISAKNIIDVQQFYYQFFERNLTGGLFWPKNVDLELVILDEDELKIANWIFRYFNSEASASTTESIILTRPIESGMLLRNAWRGRLDHVNGLLNSFIEKNSNFIQIVVLVMFFVLLATLALMYTFGIQPALLRLKHFSSVSQRKLNVHVSLAGFLEDVSTHSELLDDDPENIQKLLQRRVKPYPELHQFEFKLCSLADYQQECDNSAISMPVSSTDINSKQLQVKIPSHLADCREDIVPFVAALSNHIGLVSEVHLRMAAEQQRDVYYQFTDLAVNALPSPIAVFNEQGEPVIANPAFTAFFSQSGVDEVFKDNLQAVEKRHQHLVVEQPIDALTDIFRDGDAVEVTQLYKDDRSLVWSRLPVPNLGLAFVGHDISSVKSHLSLQEHHRRLEYLGQMSGSAAHDINNLLAIIMNTLELVADIKQNPVERNGLISSAINTCEKAAIINRQLVSFARRQNLVPNGVLPMSVIDKVRLFLISENYRDIHLKYHLDQGAIVFADPSYLVSSVINIVKNAIEAMGGVGELTINIKVLSAELVDIIVCDSGPGFTVEAIEQGFQPFYTSKSSGAGLGLAAVYGFTRQSNGQLKLYNDGGAVVKITLPRHHIDLNEKWVESHTMMVRDSSKTNNNATILLVEDNDALRQLMCTHLKMSQYHVVEASSLQEGRSKLQSMDDIDLIVTDIILSDGLGFQIANEARRLSKDVKLVYITGYGTEKFTRELTLNHALLLEKPFSLKKLSMVISELIGVNDGQAAFSTTMMKKKPIETTGSNIRIKDAS